LNRVARASQQDEAERKTTARAYKGRKPFPNRKFPEATQRSWYLEGRIRRSFLKRDGWLASKRILWLDKTASINPPSHSFIAESVDLGRRYDAMRLAMILSRGDHHHHV